MAINFLNAAFDATLHSTHKFVLVALCNHADKNGRCYPSIGRLSRCTNLSNRAVQKSISFLERERYLTREMRVGHSTMYFISDLRTWSTPEYDSPVNSVLTSLEHGTYPPVKHVHHGSEQGSPITIKEPSIKPSIEPSRNQPIGEDSKSFIVPDWIPIEPWNGYLEMRTKKNNEPTVRARRLLVEQLAKFRELGHDLTTILDCSTSNGYMKLFPPKPDSQVRVPARTEKFDPLAHVNRFRVAQ